MDWNFDPIDMGIRRPGDVTMKALRRLTLAALALLLALSVALADAEGFPSGSPRGRPGDARHVIEIKGPAYWLDLSKAGPSFWTGKRATLTVWADEDAGLVVLILPEAPNLRTGYEITILYRPSDGWQQLKLMTPEEDARSFKPCGADDHDDAWRVQPGWWVELRKSEESYPRPVYWVVNQACS